MVNQILGPAFITTAYLLPYSHIHGCPFFGHQDMKIDEWRFHKKMYSKIENQSPVILGGFQIACFMLTSKSGSEMLPLKLKKTQKKDCQKAHISHDSSVKRIFRICWDFTPKKMGEKNLVLVMDIPWNKGCQPSKAKSQIDSYSKIYQNSQNLSKKEKALQPQFAALISMISMGWNYSLTNQNMICITKSQGANIHVRSPTSGNFSSWE